MRFARTGLLAVCTLAFAAAPVHSQTEGSEDQVLRQVISGTTIEIQYSRPSVRGREPVFGELVHWMEVWTPGADEATQLEVSKDFELDDVEIPAGAYTLWLQPREDGDWQLMLHSDTTLYHVPHPTLEEGFAVLPVEPRESGYYTETLTWDIQNVAADGADLVLRWGDTEVPIALGIDPGYVVTVAPEVAAEYVGTWMMDQSMSAPSEEQVAEWRAGFAESPDATPEDLADFDEYYETIRNPRFIEIMYDEETNQLLIRDPLDEGMAEAGYSSALLPKAQGIFTDGLMQAGEVMFAGYSFYEFLFDDDGRPVSFEVRDAESDELEAVGERR